jgi:hypothetical protein
MILSQNNSGRAFEYGIAASISRQLPAVLQDGIEIRNAKRCFELADYEERQKIFKASDEITAFLIAHDKRLTDTNCSVSLQSDQHGKHGDVRDVIVRNPKTKDEIGISAKNRHFAVKHSRLSEQINFGSDWMNIPNSNTYFHTIVPIFRELRSRQRRNERWRDIPDKVQRFYIPILQAFQTEIELIFNKVTI